MKYTITFILFNVYVKCNILKVKYKAIKILIRELEKLKVDRWS